MAQIAILGFGTVGQGVAEVLETNRRSIGEKCGQEITLKAVLEERKLEDNPFSHLMVDNFDAIVNDPDIDLVVECIGGATHSYDFTKRSLLAVKQVVTSNKELVATHGTELLAIAREKNINYFFEASVGGGIPIIRPLSQCLNANRIEGITGILNGTTNYILTRMIRGRISFEEALLEAQQKGYAEADPTADVEGIDACRKLAILASLSFGKAVDANAIHTEGISKLRLEDVRYATQDGWVIKLIARAVMGADEKIRCIVSPFLLSEQHQLATVDDVFNGILVSGDMLGDAMFYGRGAGKLPTASAVVADVIDIVKDPQNRRTVFWEAADGPILGEWGQERLRLFVRLNCEDRRRALCAADELFGHCHHIYLEGAPKEELCFVTPCDQEAVLKERFAQFSASADVSGILSCLRVLS